MSGPAGAGGRNGWHRLRSRFNGGVAPQFTGSAIVQILQKKDQRGNDPTLVFSAYLPGPAGPICTAVPAVISRYGRPPQRT